MHTEHKQAGNASPLIQTCARGERNGTPGNWRELQVYVCKAFSKVFFVVGASLQRKREDKRVAFLGGPRVSALANNRCEF